MAGLPANGGERSPATFLALELKRIEEERKRPFGCNGFSLILPEEDAQGASTAAATLEGVGDNNPEDPTPEIRLQFLCRNVGSAIGRKWFVQINRH